MTQLSYDGPLRFGLFFAPFHSARLNPTYAFERDLMLAEHLDRINFDEMWFGEHHSGAMEMIAAPELMIAAAAQRTKYIRLGTGVKSLPFHNPLMLAEAMAQLDHMTRGRTIFGVGPGALPTDAHMLGLEVRDLRPHMDEALDTIMALMRGETVDRRTDWFHLRQARLHVGCFTQPMMEMAVTSVRSPAGVMAAGRHGLGVLTLGPTTDAALAHHVENWHIHEAECQRHGHVADRAKWRITVIMHIAETREKAFADAEWGFPEWIDYTHDVIPGAAGLSARCRQPRAILPRQPARHHRHARRCDPRDRTHPPGLGRVRRDPGLRQRPRALSGTAPQLRAFGRIREAAFQPRQRVAPRRATNGPPRTRPPIARKV